MCGISGIVSGSRNIQEQLIKAQQIQLHRGPDSQGICQQQINRWQIGLGHQRLSILDLTDTGTQPMVSANENSWLVYNGEIYNYLEIRQQLEASGYQFKGSSDTEVLVAALEYWGIEQALPRFNGMWAFAWLDKRSQQLFLSRDRVGIKPLYFHISKENLYFASEIKAILEISPYKFDLNYQIIGEYLIQSLSNSSNQTCFTAIEKIPAGSYAVLDLSSDSLHLQFKSYWNISSTPSEDFLEDPVEQLRNLFFDAVRLRLRSDVPVGVLLSGGIDSSSIAVAMQTILGKEANLNLLSSVSKDTRYDESPFIDIMARHLQRPVQKIVLDFQPTQVFDYLEKVSWFYDEPVGSFSNVAHYLLMKKAQEMDITVILSGQGADELLCGYKKYLGFYVKALLHQGKYLKASEVLLSFWKQGTIINQFSFAEAKRYLPRFLSYYQLSSCGTALKDFVWQSVGLSSKMTVLERQCLDLQRFSVPALVHSEDRMSMACSREIRVPFLDYRLIEFLITLPTEMKLSQGWTKFIFRRAMEPYLPPAITWRRDKQGFVNPQSQWLKHELKEKVLEHFSSDSLIFQKEIVDRAKLLEQYEAFCSNKTNRETVWFKDIFNPLALEIWLRKFEQYLA